MARVSVGLALVLSLMHSAPSAPCREIIEVASACVPSPNCTIAYLPQRPHPGARFPLVFLLHGWTDDPWSWSEFIELQHCADDYGFILICPDGYRDGWYLDSPVRPEMQYETFFYRDLVPAVLRHFADAAEPRAIFITGVSMGGFGALHFFLKRPDFFLAAGSSSGILDIAPFSKRFGLSRILGPYETNTIRWRANSDINLLDGPARLIRPFIVDCGTEDLAWAVNERFEARCRELHLPITFIERPGGHTRDYWNASLREQFRFFQDVLRRQTFAGIAPDSADQALRRKTTER